MSITPWEWTMKEQDRRASQLLTMVIGYRVVFLGYIYIYVYIYMYMIYIYIYVHIYSLLWYATVKKNGAERSELSLFGNYPQPNWAAEQSWSDVRFPSPWWVELLFIGKAKVLRNRRCAWTNGWEMMKHDETCDVFMWDMIFQWFEKLQTGKPNWCIVWETLDKFLHMTTAIIADSMDIVIFPIFNLQWSCWWFINM